MSSEQFRVVGWLLALCALPGGRRVPSHAENHSFQGRGKKARGQGTRESAINRPVDYNGATGQPLDSSLDDIDICAWMCNVEASIVVGVEESGDR